MKEFLRKIKLLDQLTSEIQIDRNLFVQRFEQQIDHADIGVFSDFFDAFSRSKNEYRGHLNYDGFKIKRKTKFFDMNMNSAVATGVFEQKNDHLVIKTEINGFHGMMIPFCIFIILFYLIFIFGFLYSAFSGQSDGNLVFFVPFIIIHAAFTFGIPYFMMRRSTGRMKHELEREFFYMTKEIT